MKKKIYGEYPGSIKNVEDVNKLTEVELFLAISSLENYLLTYKRVTAFNMSKGIDISDDEYALEYLINRTQNFGVELEKDIQGKVIKTGDYACWYQYFMQHFNKILTRGEFKKFLELKSKGYNVSRYLPNDSYLEYKNKIRKFPDKTYINTSVKVV